MANIYRKSSLDKLSNPEQLDRMIKISSPLSWLALIAVLLIIVATVVWSIIGELPTTEIVSGTIVDSNNVGSVYSDSSGVLEKYCVEIGNEIKSGDKIAEAKLSDGTIKEINADQNGVLSAFSSEPGSSILTGTEIARITPSDFGEQVIVCYVPLAYAHKFKEGMEVLVYPLSVDTQKYGHMEAEVVSVDQYAANTDSLGYVLGSGNMVAEQYASNGPIVSVLCKIKSDNTTKSGFYWSSSSAKNLAVHSGTSVSAKIVVDKCAPITKLIGSFNEDSEG